MPNVMFFLPNLYISDRWLDVDLRVDLETELSLEDGVGQRTEALRGPRRVKHHSLGVPLRL